MTCRIRESVGRAGRILAAAVGVEVELRSGVGLQAAQPRRGTDRSKRAIWPRRHVRQLRRAVATDAIPSLEVRNEVEFLGDDRKSPSCSDTASHRRIVKGTGDSIRGSASGGRKSWKGKSAARINAAAERAENAHYFIVAPSRIQCGFDEEVRRLVCRITGRVNKVEKTAALSRNIEEEVVAGAVGGVSGLRAFDRQPHRKFIVKTFNHAETVGALPCPAHDVLRVDLQRKGFLTVFDALLTLGHKAPHLSAGDGESVFPSNPSPQLTLAEDVAVALAVVG